MRFRGGTYRLNRAHPLADGIVACIVFDKPNAWGYDAVTGQVFTGTNSPAIGATKEGRGVSLSGTAFVSSPSNDRWNVLNEVTVAWRGIIRSTASAGQLIGKYPSGGAGGNDTPFSLEYTNPTGGKVSFGRANAGFPSFRLWESGSSLVTTNALLTLSVSGPATVQTAPSFYLNGVLDTAAPTSQYGGTATGPATGNTGPLLVGRRADGGEQMDGITAIAVVANRMWSAREHALFNADPYGLVTIRKRRLSGAASPDVTVALTGSSATASAGTLAPGLSAALTGAATTFAQGDVAVEGPATAGGMTRTRRGARRIYLPQPQDEPEIVMPSNIVRADNGLPDDDEEAWILLG